MVDVGVVVVVEAGVLVVIVVEVGVVVLVVVVVEAGVTLGGAGADTLTQLE